MGLAKPVSDVSAGPWQSTAASLFDAIDEDAANDADYIYTNTAGVCELGLATITDPGTDTGFALQYRVASDNGQRSVRVALYDGATLIAEEIRQNVPTVETTYTMAIDASAMANVSDFTALRLELELLSSTVDSTGTTVDSTTVTVDRS